jgi:hypothetical protein
MFPAEACWLTSRQRADEPGVQTAPAVSDVRGHIRLTICWLPGAGILFTLAACLLLFVKAEAQARSSAGEHFPDAEGVDGSIPSVPTNSSAEAI